MSAKYDGTTKHFKEQTVFVQDDDESHDASKHVVRLGGIALLTNKDL